MILLQDFLAIDAAVAEFTAAYQREPVRFFESSTAAHRKHIMMIITTTLHTGCCLCCGVMSHR
jgi:hypothetical protein